MPGPVTTTTDWTLDVDEVILAASERLRRPDLPAFNIRTARRAINFCFNRFATVGLNLWTIDLLVTLDLTPGQASYSLPTGTLDVLEIVYRDTSESDPTDIEVTRGSRDDYTLQPNKDERGAPTFAYVQRGRDNPTMWVWPTPDRGTYQIRYNRIRRFYDLGNNLAAIDVPDHWLGVLVAGVTYYLSLVTPGTTPEERAEFKAQFEDEMATISPEDRDRSVLRIELDLMDYYR